MPYEKVSAGKGKYNVVNKESGRVHARGTTNSKAEAQLRFLRGIEHGMVPKTTSEAAGIHTGPKSSEKGALKTTKHSSPKLRTTRETIGGFAVGGKRHSKKSTKSSRSKK